MTAWDDQTVPWGSFDLVVIRSPWDYSWRSFEFLRWLDSCSALTTVVNDPAVIRWNADKTYLRHLARSSVPVVPTEYLRPGETITLPQDFEFVVKPSVGAGARHAARYQPRDRVAAEAHVLRLHAERTTAMVQPYIHEIDAVGERALVYIDGKFLHAIRKNAVLTPGLRFDDRRDGHPGAAPWQPGDTELAVAQRAIDAIPFDQRLLYTRVDMVTSPESGVVITELELIEPGLYLRFHPGSEVRVAEAIIGMAERAVRPATLPVAT
ncbi:hypothetical protein AB0B48_05090 [Micromonospora sp. NPDC049089]|uniref:ATP-grasp domain-containing protein n=1 Tax=Micromonospora sp. NPDC049089 TaxID=3155496 RepID=UPI0033F94A9C